MIMRQRANVRSFDERVRQLRAEAVAGNMWSRSRGNAERSDLERREMGDACVSQASGTGARGSSGHPSKHSEGSHRFPTAII